MEIKRAFSIPEGLRCVVVSGRGGLAGCSEEEGSHYQLLETRVGAREEIVLIDPVITA